MPITSHHVPEAILIRYCNLCYRLAELQVHTKIAYKNVVRGNTRCGYRQIGAPRNCSGFLTIRPREMRSMMVARIRWPREDGFNYPIPYAPIDPIRAAQNDAIEPQPRQELERQLLNMSINTPILPPSNTRRRR